MARIRTGTILATVLAALALAAPAGAVTGGTPPSRDYPFMAAMLWDGVQVCGGSLVASEYVLTAAHCWDSDGDPDTEEPTLDSVDFVFGEPNLRLDEWDSVSAASVELHENWEPETGSLAYDVALVRLSKPVAATPIPLADPDTEQELWEAEPGLTAPRKMARVIGYGLPSFDPPGQMFEADVPMVADQDCERSYDLTNDLAQASFESDTMVCAGEPFGVRDSCFGDSGGPLMVARDRDLAEDPLIQVGIVSWGFACGVPQQPGVYARVGDNPLHDWIQRRIGGTTTPTEPGTIAGEVTDARTDAGLASATVDCGNAGSATTDATGAYSLTDVPSATYTCTASKDGYASKKRTVTVPSGGTATANFALRPLAQGKGKGKEKGKDRGKGKARGKAKGKDKNR